jgi:hypothetical protein
MNIAHIERRERELKARAEDLSARNKDCEAKGDPAWLTKSIDRDLRELQTEWEQVAAERKQYEAGKAFVNKMGGNPGGQKGFGTAETKAVTAKTVSPLQVPVSEYRGLFEAVNKKLPTYRIDTKGAFAESAFTSGNLPPELMPHLSLDLPYEPDRAFEHFKQLTAPEARAVEYVQHTGNTNPAAAVAELGTKPDLGMELTTVTTPFVKIAALASVSTEALQDFSAFMQWVPLELQPGITTRPD